MTFLFGCCSFFLSILAYLLIIIINPLPGESGEAQITIFQDFWNCLFIITIFVSAFLGSVFLWKAIETNKSFLKLIVGVFFLLNLLWCAIITLSAIVGFLEWL